MVSVLHPQHPDITDDMWNEIDEVIDGRRSQPGSVIAVLRECQAIAGYLPVELIDHIATALNLSKSRVFGVVSFYSLFSLKPKGRHTVKCCIGTACYVKGIKETLSRIQNEYKLEEGGTTEDRRFSLMSVRCLGACGLAPVMVIDDDVHGDVNPGKVDAILEQYA